MYISLHDSWQLASKLSLKRIKNAYSIYRSYQQARQSRQPVIEGLPISISVEPTTACNLRCPECPSGLRSFTRPTGKLNPALLDQLLSEIGDTLLYMIFYFQGEPYLHPDFLEMVGQANARRIYTATSTNAHFLNEENARKTVESGLDRLIISIDGATQQTYEAYRKTGRLDKVLEGTREILKWKRLLKSHTPHVVWQYLVVGPNEHEIPQIKKMAREYGVDHLAFKTAQIYDYHHGHELIPKDLTYSRYKPNENGSWSLKHALEDECWKMWHSCVITWDGQVVPCCFDKDATHSLGTIGDRSFKEVWNSDSYRDFRQTLFHSRDQIEMCRNCTEGAQVWA